MIYFSLNDMANVYNGMYACLIKKFPNDFLMILPIAKKKNFHYNIKTYFVNYLNGIFE